MSSEGMDVPGLDTIILASPKSDVEQSVGRILRLKAEDRRYQALVIDIHDDIGVFVNQARKRRAFYKAQAYDAGFQCTVGATRTTDQQPFEPSRAGSNTTDQQSSKAGLSTDSSIIEILIPALSSLIVDRDQDTEDVPVIQTGVCLL
jgi:superfamily II DNA or RNA helicase